MMNYGHHPKYDSLEKLIIKGIEINSIGEVI